MPLQGEIVSASPEDLNPSLTSLSTSSDVVSSQPRSRYICYQKPYNWSYTADSSSYTPAQKNPPPRWYNPVRYTGIFLVRHGGCSNGRLCDAVGVESQHSQVSSTVL